MCRLKRGSAFVALDCFVALTGMNQPCYTAAAAAAAPCWAGSFRVRGSIAAEATGAAVRQGAGGYHARLLREGCRPPLRGRAAAHHARKRARPPASNRWRAQRAAKDGYASSARKRSLAHSAGQHCARRNGPMCVCAATDNGGVEGDDQRPVCVCVCVCARARARVCVHSRGRRWGGRG